jgi:hypothetical protein
MVFLGVESGAAVNLGSKTATSGPIQRPPFPPFESWPAHSESRFPGSWRGVSTDKVIIEPGQVKLFYVLQEKVVLRNADESYRMSEGDSALVDGAAAHGWGNIGRGRARVLWVILG